MCANALPEGNTDGDEDELDTLLAAYTAQAAAEAQEALQKHQQRQQRRQPKKAAVMRDEALAEHLPEHDKGFELLAKMGFKPGQGLGKEKQVRIGGRLRVRVRGRDM